MLHQNYNLRRETQKKIAASFSFDCVIDCPLFKVEFLKNRPSKSHQFYQTSKSATQYGYKATPFLNF